MSFIWQNVSAKQTEKIESFFLFCSIYPQQQWGAVLLLLRLIVVSLSFARVLSFLLSGICMFVKLWLRVGKAVQKQEESKHFYRQPEKLFPHKHRTRF